MHKYLHKFKYNSADMYIQMYINIDTDIHDYTNINKHDTPVAMLRQKRQLPGLVVSPPSPTPLAVQSSVHPKVQGSFQSSTPPEIRLCYLIYVCALVAALHVISGGTLIRIRIINMKTNRKRNT